MRSAKRVLRAEMSGISSASAISAIFLKCDAGYKTGDAVCDKFPFK